MRRHGSWLVPLVLVPVVFLLPLAVVELLPEPTALGPALARLAVLLVAVVAPLVALGLAVRGGWRTYGAWRRRNGHLPPEEVAQRHRDERFHRAWAGAGEVRRALLRREPPAQVRVWDLVPAEGEVFFLDAPAVYSRYYGQDVAYTQASGFYLGPPAFVLAGMGLTAVGNARRRSAAEREAQERWREHQTCRLVVSNQRLLCFAGGRWLSFWYGGMTAVHPGVREWSLVCQFDGAAPLALSGAPVPAAAVITTMATLGLDAVAEHPSLQALDG
ncbi:hypothetical protein [uncultured Pseudokineococcus sp.]|uniref:hypothetical protein n=1 Tax=uncultured Pseudokineococcus sp. TaxID=1642928 RepID=UPI002624F982|nr:hypothetical protein [uncultured Pseudokineococcus sp.]